MKKAKSTLRKIQIDLDIDQIIDHIIVMDIVTYSEARNNLKSLLDRVVDDHMPTVIFRQRGESVVIMPKTDYDSWIETRYLLSTPVNADQLRRSIRQFRTKVDQNPMKESYIMHSETTLFFPDGRHFNTHFITLPEKGDTVIFDNTVYLVQERGWSVSTGNDENSFLRLTEVEHMIDSPSGRYACVLRAREEA